MNVFGKSLIRGGIISFIGLCMQFPIT